MGGVCTLIGTSSNLLVDSLSQKHGLAPLGVFEFTKLGVLLAVAGIVYLMVIGRWLLPRQIDTQMPEIMQVGKYVTELKVMSDSTLVGQTIAEARLEEFRRQTRLEIDPEFRHARDDGEARMLMEVLVTPASPMEARTLPELDLQSRYDATVLAIHRRGHVLREKMSRIPFEVGDVLMLLVPETVVGKLRADDRFIILNERDDARRPPYKALVAVAIMIGVVVVSGLRVLPIPIAAICGVVAMALTRCFGRKDVYEAMDWKIIILLGAILPLGIAIEK